MNNVTSLFEREPEPRHGTGSDRVLWMLKLDTAAMFCLCGHLEDLADGLPGGIGVHAASAAADLLARVLGGHCAMYDGLVLPAIAAAPACAPHVRPGADQAAREHRELLGLAVELREALAEGTASDRPCQVDRLGLLLRAMFEGVRRHLAWERCVVIDAVRRSIEPEARAALGVQISDSRMAEFDRLARLGFLKGDLAALRD